MFSPAVLDHFQNPRNAGEVDNATATIEVTNPVCGDVLRLTVRIENGRIVAARFKARGCVTAMACSSLITELLIGKNKQEAQDITANQVSSLLGGLPPATFHGSQLVIDAVESILKKLS